MPKVKETVWVEGMKPPRGAKHTREFSILVNRSKRKGPFLGTVENPSVTWIHRIPESREVVLATERIVKEHASRYGMSYAWVMMMGHDLSTIKKTVKGRTLSDDDHHVTIRMGIDPNVCNLHGHIYFICEDWTPEVEEELRKVLVPVRTMDEEERGIVGGKNPHLWVWGPYPSPSPEYPRAPFDYPRSPYQIKPGSILEKKAFHSKKAPRAGM